MTPQDRKSRTGIRLPRRRFLAVVAGLTVGVWLWRDRPRHRPRAWSLHEADFYRPHDLAG